jgi:hypothetical protein
VPVGHMQGTEAPMHTVVTTVTIIIIHTLTTTTRMDIILTLFIQHILIHITPTVGMIGIIIVGITGVGMIGTIMVVIIVMTLITTMIVIKKPTIIKQDLKKCV